MRLPSVAFEQIAHAVELCLARGQFRVVAFELGGVLRQRLLADFQLRFAVGEQFGHVLGLTAEALVVGAGGFEATLARGKLHAAVSRFSAQFLALFAAGRRYPPSGL